MIKKLLFFASVAFVLQSCYYDKEDVLYLGGNACDTTTVTYSATIQPLLQTYCTGCHGNSGGVTLENYAQVKAAVDNGSLSGTVNQTGVYSLMPQGGPKLSTCKLRQIDIWIKNGAKND
jgi:hypothetical protein